MITENSRKLDDARFELTQQQERFERQLAQKDGELAEKREEKDQFRQEMEGNLFQKQQEVESLKLELARIQQRCQQAESYIQQAEEGKKGQM